METFNCKQCNKQFNAYLRKDRNVSFCSLKCSHLSNIGRIVSEEHKNRLSLLNKGKTLSQETKDKISKNNARIWLGKKRPNLHSEETKKKMSEIKKGKPAWNKGLKGFRAGKNHQWYGINRSGINSPVYIKDRSLLKKSERKDKDSAYIDWRLQVYKRDNHECKMKNNECKGRIEAHHILPWRDHKSLRYDINNGICLCKYHHPRKRIEEARLSPYFQEIINNNKY